MFIDRFMEVIKIKATKDDTDAPISKDIEGKWEKLKKDTKGALKDRAEVILKETPKTELIPSTDKVIMVPGEDGPAANAIDLLTKIKEEGITGRDISADERRLVVTLLKNAGQTQDQISSLLQVSRTTITSDYRWLREQAAMQIAAMKSPEFAGDIWMTTHNLINNATQEKMSRTASSIQKDLIELLQSIGVVPRVPKTIKSLSLVGKLNASRRGFGKYMETIGDEKETVECVLDELMECIIKET